MMKLPLALMALALLGCGKKPPAPDPAAGQVAPASVAPPRPSEPSPFTVTYTYRGKADAPPLMFIMSSDGAVTAMSTSPPARFVGKTDESTLTDISRLIAEAPLRALPASNTSEPLPIVELELLDAKGVLWRRHFTGSPPEAARVLFNRLENLQTAARKDDRPAGIVQIDVTRTAPGKPTEVLSVRGNSLVLVTSDGRPKALGKVGGNDLDTLRIAAGMLAPLRPTTAPAGEGTRYALRIQHADDTARDLALDGGIPLAAEPLFKTLDALEAATKPVAQFDKITYQVPVPGKRNSKQLLTVLPSGALTLTADGATIGSGDAAIEDLWGLHAVLVALEAIAPGAPVGRGEETLRVEGPTGVREVRMKSGDAPADAKKVIAYMNRFLIQIGPPLPE